MTESILINRPTISLPKKSEPVKYTISLKRRNQGRFGNIIIWESFSNELARAFSLDPATMYAFLKNSIVNGRVVIFGEYTKDVADTRISNAQAICKKYKPSILPIFEKIKM